MLNLSITKLHFPGNQDLPAPITVSLYYKEYYTADFTLIGFGFRARDSIVEDLIVSSYTAMAVAGTNSVVRIFKIDGATRCATTNPYVRAGRPTNLNGDTEFFVDLRKCDQFAIRGGDIVLSERLLSTRLGVSGDTIRGFSWTGNPKIVNTANPNGNGLIYFDTGGGAAISSGTVLSGFRVFHNVATTQPTLLMSGGEAFSVEDFYVYHTAGGSSGGGFNTGASVRSAVFTGNKIFGTTGCMSDSGVNTRWTDASGGGKNFCNGAGQ